MINFENAINFKIITHYFKTCNKLYINIFTLYTLVHASMIEHDNIVLTCD